MNRTGLGPALLSALLASGGAEVAAAPAHQAAEPRELRSAVDSAISRVYPSLVRIHVVGVQYEGGREVKSESSGSGVIISTDGYVVTNHHVAGKARRLRCTMADRQELEARLVGTDPLTDIAVIQLDLAGREQPLPAARFGDSSRLAVGDRVLAMGSPLALSQSVTLGIVSNLEMTMPKLFWPATFELDGEETGSLVKWIGHDAQIFPGNSGGPLVDLDGEIVGINEISLGLAGAIPGNLAREVAEQLIERGLIERSWLGLRLQPLLLSDPRAERGVLVSSVVPGSPAERAGLAAGDVLTGYDGVPLHVRYGEELPEVNRLMLQTPVGAEVEIAYRRDGALRHATAVTVARGAALGQEVELQRLGVTVRELTLLSAKELNREPGTGVLVSSVRPGAAAAEAEPPLQPGDIVVDLDGGTVDDVAALSERIAAVAENETALVGFERRSERLLTVVRPGRRGARDRSVEAVKAWIPVATQVLTSDLAGALAVDAAGGVRVSEVYPGSSAEAAGIRVGDVFVALDGQPIPASRLEDAEVFASIVRQYRVGSTVALDGFRHGDPLSVEVELVESPRSERELVEYRDVRFDFSARDLTFRDRRDPRLSSDQVGALITGVESGGWAALARLAVGDIVLAIDGEPIRSGGELEHRMLRIAERRPKRVVFLVRRGVSTLFLELEPDWGAR